MLPQQQWCIAKRRHHETPGPRKLTRGQYSQGQQQQQQHGGRGKRDRSSRPRDWDASDVSYSGSDSEVRAWG